MGMDVKSLDDAIAAFIEGAKIHHCGYFIDSNRMALRGLKRTRDGTDYIDAHSPNARDVLIPLLYHPEDEVRVTAASALIRSRPDLAIPVIEDIRANCVTEARTTAGLIMNFKEVFGHFGLGVASPDPRYPHPEDAREASDNRLQ